MDISIIIPMFNEAENVEITLKRVEEVLSSIQGSFEIIPVNDGSVDNTLEVLRKVAERNKNIKIASYPKNVGRGMALRTGFNESTGDMIVSIDADLSFAPNHIIDLINVLKNEPDVDFVLGSPFIPGGVVQNVPFHRLWISKLGNKVLRYTMPNRIYYSTGVFRAYRRKVIDSLELESDDKEIHLEILSKAIALGYLVKEVPVVLSARTRGKSKFKFKKTALSHLVFSAFERPMVIFGFLGLLSLGIGLLIGLYIAFLSFSGELTPGRPLITFSILLILGGIQILSFGFIALQIVSLRREILRIQKENLELRKEIKNL
ncbi:MAG TPA: glycosyltransferase [Thermodesulfobacteriota bacterium]|nr:glycosyltransferase [Thermodesulfobacteriota bacterium]